MWKIGFCILAGHAIVMLLANDDMGRGVWRVLNVEKREQQYHKLKFDLEQRKVNRSHDGFNGQFTLDEDFTDVFGIRVEICKYVDGGCKQYQILTDNSVINFINKYAEGNKKLILENAGVDPPDFPIKKGTYEFNNYLFNYEELPADGIYGEFAAVAYLLQGTEEISCVELQVEFRKVEDHEGCEDHDDEYDE